MKLISHYVFTLGLLELLSGQAAILMAIAAWDALIVNWLIDAGHTVREGRPIRSRVTHSIFTAPEIGALVSLAPLLFLRYFISVTATALFAGAALGILAALSHLFLDSLTEGGVYLWRRRLALAHFRNGNAFANGLAVAAGVILLLLAFVRPI